MRIVTVIAATLVSTAAVAAEPAFLTALPSTMAAGAAGDAGTACADAARGLPRGVARIMSIEVGYAFEPCAVADDPCRPAAAARCSLGFGVGAVPGPGLSLGMAFEMRRDALGAGVRVSYSPPVRPAEREPGDGRNGW